MNHESDTGHKSEEAECGVNFAAAARPGAWHVRTIVIIVTRLLGVRVAVGVALAVFVLTGAQAKRAVARSTGSPPGTIFYVNDVDGDGGTRRARVFKVRPDGNGRVALTPSSRHATGAAPSPDGRRIAYGLSVDGSAGVHGHFFLANADGSSRRRLRNGYLAAWSPDSRSYALLTDRISERPPGIRIVDSSGRVKWLTRGRGDSVHAWSLDGRRIAFWRGDSLVSINVTGGGWRRLARRPPGNVGEMVLSPDWTKLVFTDGNNELFHRDQRSRVTRKLRVHGHELRWSPDSGTFAFLSNTRGGCRLYIARADGRAQRVVPGTGFCPGKVTWSPDSTTLAYTRLVVAKPKPKWEIWTMRPDGSEQRRIAPRGSLWDLSWTR
jgi:Tol biopolymer transport system component